MSNLRFSTKQMWLHCLAQDLPGLRSVEKPNWELCDPPGILDVSHVYRAHVRPVVAAFGVMVVRDATAV